MDPKSRVSAMEPHVGKQQWLTFRRSPCNPTCLHTLSPSSPRWYHLFRANSAQRFKFHGPRPICTISIPASCSPKCTLSKGRFPAYAQKAMYAGPPSFSNSMVSKPYSFLGQEKPLAHRESHLCLHVPAGSLSQLLDFDLHTAKGSC